MPWIQTVYTPCGAPVVWKVLHVTVPFGARPTPGVKPSGVSVVPHGCDVSPQLANAYVLTRPVNDAFFVTLIVIEPLRFWFVLIVTVLGTA